MLYRFPLIIFFSLVFSRIVHPLSTGIILLVQTITISVSARLFKTTYWFSYILFLIFLGGILILFIYVTSLASNEKFKIKIEFLFVSFFAFLSSLILTIFDPLFMANKFETAISSIININIEISEASLRVRIIYNKPSAFFTLFIIRYLLLTLFVIVKIIRSSSRPLRTSSS